MRVGGKRTKPLSIEVLCDWAERAQPTTTQLQRRRVYWRKTSPSQKECIIPILLSRQSEISPEKALETKRELSIRSYFN